MVVSIVKLLFEDEICFERRWTPTGNPWGFPAQCRTFFFTGRSRSFGCWEILVQVRACTLHTVASIKKTLSLLDTWTSILDFRTTWNPHRDCFIELSGNLGNILFYQTETAREAIEGSHREHQANWFLPCATSLRRYTRCIWESTSNNVFLVREEHSGSSSASH